MKKIGIMGGTFNPIHIAHLILAEKSYEHLKLDKVLFMPSKKPPHKQKEHIEEDVHRVKMIQLAIKDNPHFEFSDLELQREGFTYTANTLEILTQENPDNEYYFIMGADSLVEMHNWYKPEIILKLSHIVVFGRNHMPDDELKTQIEELKTQYNANIHFIKVANMDISSKMLREFVNIDESIRYYVPETVNVYIKENRLYSNN